jgi:hypothetical protein
MVWGFLDGIVHCLWSALSPEAQVKIAGVSGMAIMNMRVKSSAIRVSGKPV